MQVQLNFDSSVEAQEIECAIKSMDMYNALWTITAYLRNVEKFELGHDIEEIRKNVSESIMDYGISLDYINDLCLRGGAEEEINDEQGTDVTGDYRPEEDNRGYDFDPTTAND